MSTSRIASSCIHETLLFALNITDAHLLSNGENFKERPTFRALFGAELPYEKSALKIYGSSFILIHTSLETRIINTPGKNDGLLGACSTCLRPSHNTKNQSALVMNGHAFLFYPLALHPLTHLCRSRTARKRAIQPVFMTFVRSLHVVFLLLPQHLSASPDQRLRLVLHQ
ncbi:hypothetical protein CFELI_14285 [Corynebacterium felinum]|uniref:Uncharacterized protein n=1 Tax=Corynebacterium felinum TaxID=131318 RepID=A0ABU2B775_9CORY|nr:hypothetical protein [Corynebacterium felinum]WJY96428.1 hypothetical protein CFELI_14285 [Corynebacterium felinum]